MKASVVICGIITASAYACDAPFRFLKEKAACAVEVNVPKENDELRPLVIRWNNDEESVASACKSLKTMLSGMMDEWRKRCQLTPLAPLDNIGYFSFLTGDDYPDKIICRRIAKSIRRRYQLSGMMAKVVPIYIRSKKYTKLVSSPILEEENECEIEASNE